MEASSFSATSAVGIGLRSPHYQQVRHSPLSLAPWWEVHSENFFSEGGVSLALLQSIRDRYPVSFHGVGLSLGSAQPLCKEHLRKLAALVRRFQPFLVSEHLAWSVAGGVFANDLLPVPLTEESLSVVVSHIVQLQDVLQRQVLLENPSSYVQFACSTMPEWEFMAEVARQSGCAILLDVNNIYVSAINHGYVPDFYIDMIPKDAVGEMHLAGHSMEEIGGEPLLIDTHSGRISEEVWVLYRRALARFGVVPTLIEWDVDIPPLSVLREEADKASAIIEEYMSVPCNS